MTLFEIHKRRDHVCIVDSCGPTSPGSTTAAKIRVLRCEPNRPHRIEEAGPLLFLGPATRDSNWVDDINTARVCHSPEPAAEEEEDKRAAAAAAAGPVVVRSAAGERK